MSKEEGTTYRCDFCGYLVKDLHEEWIVIKSESNITAEICDDALKQQVIVSEKNRLDFCCTSCLNDFFVGGQKNEEADKFKC